MRAVNAADRLAAVTVLNPPPAAPPGLVDFTNQVLGYAKWMVGALAVLFILGCAIMIIAGRRQRSATAYNGLEGAAWIIAGLGVAGFGPLIVLAFRL